MRLGSQRQLARELDIQPSYINKLYKADDYRIIKVGKKIDLDKTIDRLVKSGFGQKSGELKKRERKPIKENREGSQETESNDTISELIAEEKKERIKKLKINNEMAENKLVYIDELESVWFETGRRLRDSLLTIPARIAMKLVGKSAHEIEMELTEEIKFSLTNLPEEQPRIENKIKI